LVPRPSNRLFIFSFEEFVVKYVRITLIFIVLPFCIFELWLKSQLFQQISYTKSKAMDNTIKDLAKTSVNDVYFFGDSEVRWGVNPFYFDEKSKQNGLNIQSFNFGIDGFSSGLNLSMTQKIGIDDFKGIKVALIGVQLIEYNRPFNSEEDIRRLVGNGALQRPIFLSSYGVDKQLYYWTESKKNLLNYFPFYSFKYRSSVKELFVSYPKPTVSTTYSLRGYEPHISIAANQDNFNSDKENKSKEKQEEPENFQPLDEKLWQETLAEGKYFDNYANFFLANNVLPVFFALPTNPWLIDFKERRINYRQNSKALQNWADQNGLVFIDGGILDNFSATEDFADFRHLSARGADKFSDILAKKLLENLKVVNFFNASPQEREAYVKGLLALCGPIKHYTLERMRDEFVVDYDIDAVLIDNNSLLIKSIGNDSRLIVNTPNAGKQIKVGLSIETPEDTTFTISWVTTSQPGFSNEMTQERTLRKGINTFTIDIVAGDEVQKLRIDPGQLPGNYRIHAFSYSMSCNET
jgi:hypothetical protein